MFRTHILAKTAGTLAIAGAALFSNVASAGGNVGWSVSIGGPGFAVNAGAPVFAGPVAFAPYRPWVRPHFRPVFVPRPVYFQPAPVFVPAPVRFYRPAPVVFATGRFGY